MIPKRVPSPHPSGVVNFSSRQQGAAEWLLALRGEAAKGMPALFTALRMADERLPKPLEKALLKAVLEWVPELHVDVSPEAAELVLRHCLRWTRLSSLDECLELFDHFRMACVCLSPPAEDKLKATLTGLLGLPARRIVGASPIEIRIRLSMAHPSPAHEGLALALPGPGAAEPTEPAFPLMQLPRELRQAVLGWLFPEPVSADELAWANRRGQALMSVCTSFQADVQPLLRNCAPGYWRHGARLRTSPASAVWHFLQLLENSESREFTLAEAKRMACSICLLPEREPFEAALQALFKNLARPEWAWLLPQVATTCAMVLCLADSDGHDQAWLERLTRLQQCTGVDDFQRHCVAHLRVCIDTQLPDGGVRMRGKDVTPAHPVDRHLLAFLNKLPHLAEAERFKRLREVDGAFCDSGTPDSLSSVMLIAMVHAMSESDDGLLVHSPTWWSFAAQRVKTLLTFLNAVWPGDTPLPGATLLRCIPLDLLRWAFGQLKSRERIALLQRPLALAQDGSCWQLPLLCDFFLDGSVPDVERMALLASCQHSAPLAAQLGAVAWDWSTLSVPKRPGPKADDGGEQFLRESCRLRERWEVANAPLASRVRDAKALLSRANGPEDFFLGLCLIDECLPKPVDIPLLHWVLDRIPRVCLHESQSARSLLRHSFVAAALEMSDRGQRALLKRLCHASSLLPVETAVRLWSALVCAVYEHAGLVHALKDLMDGYYLTLLHTHAAACQRMSVKDAWRHWKAATADIDLSRLPPNLAKKIEAIDAYFVKLRPYEEAEAQRPRV